MIVHWIGLHFSVFVLTWKLTQVVVDLWFKVEEFLHKIAICLKNWRADQENRSFRVHWSDWALCSQHLLRLHAVLSVHLCISISLPLLLCFFGSTSPFGRPSAFLEYRHSLVPPLYACCISLCSAQSTTPEGVLFQCWFSRTLTLTISIGIWHSAGVMKEVNSPAAHCGI